MVDSIFTQGAVKPGMIARLKVGTSPPSAVLPASLSAPEKNLTDIIQLSADAQGKLTQAKKLDAYLRTFTSALKIFNGTGLSPSYRPSFSTVDIEYIEIKKPRIDTKA